MKDLRSRRLRPALPYTVLTGPDTVRLVAGEDHRYTLTGPGLERWLPALLASLDGRRLEEALAELVPEHRAEALGWVERLYGERMLVDAPAVAGHPVAVHRLRVEGTGPLVGLLVTADAPGDGPELAVLCQDRLDYEEALRFNLNCRAGDAPWLWASYGPMSRGYVSPAFLPDAGPCLACLIRQFQRLSPAPEIYDALLDHARQGRPVTPVPFPAEATAILGQLVRWKAALLAHPEPPPALYRLHVLELETLEVSSHRVFVDPGCPACGGGR
jgi:bacteriocin biosynthesis cyclodehydratase domain-containing protein